MRRGGVVSSTWSGDQPEPDTRQPYQTEHWCAHCPYVVATWRVSWGESPRSADFDHLCDECIETEAEHYAAPVTFAYDSDGWVLP